MLIDLLGSWLKLQLQHEWWRSNGHKVRGGLGSGLACPQCYPQPCRSHQNPNGELLLNGGNCAFQSIFISLIPTFRFSSAEQFGFRFRVAFVIFAVLNVTAALRAPILDCDETFNYWEPTHYLSHGYGLQTWEYSPEFAIRSWSYVAVHALIGRVGYMFTFSKTFEFYWIRCVLALTCSYCETRLFVTISKTLNPRAGIMFMLIMLSTPGMFSASAAYLPSSFAMNANMLGASAFMNWRSGPHTAAGITWFGIGGIIGWPFAAALVVPFMLEEVAMTWVTTEWIELLRRTLRGCVHLAIAAVSAGICRALMLTFTDYSSFVGNILLPQGGSGTLEHRRL